ncbi:MAG: N-acetylmuramoyl-L-alanine amidase [bacterium]
MKKLLFSILFFVVLFSVPIFQVDAITTTPIKILLVPGHDNEIWGAQYKNIKEAAMNLAVASRVYNLLNKDKRFEVYITRDLDGYTKEFADYFSTQRDAILAFEHNAKNLMQTKVATGNFVEKENVVHNTASEDMVVRLYGINKWANENNVDAVIHVHFNDYPRPNSWTAGKYKGLAIYMPDGQFVNSRESSLLAADIYTQLRKKYLTSTYPPELGGLVSDQKLIAMGANETLISSVRSVLIEYGYIYRFGDSVARHKSYDNFAQYTATGIKNYFFVK